MKISWFHQHEESKTTFKKEQRKPNYSTENMRTETGVKKSKVVK